MSTMKLAVLHYFNTFYLMLHVGYVTSVKKELLMGVQRGLWMGVQRGLLIRVQKGLWMGVQRGLLMRVQRGLLMGVQRGLLRGSKSCTIVCGFSSWRPFQK